MAEQIVLLVILRTSYFLNFLYTLDLFVVTASLVFEITFMVMNEDTLASLAGLLIIARVWRFVRLGHGLVTTAVEVEDEKIDQLEERIAELENLLFQHGVQVPSWTKPERRGSEISDNYQNILA
jgi:hypothetical protein